MVLILDNYDSFVYNIREWLSTNNDSIIIKRNDEVQAGDLEQMGVSHIIISPGPMGPEHAGFSCDIIKAYAKRIPILGICLGHQCIGHAFSCTIAQHPQPQHGKTSLITLHASSLYKGLPTVVEFARYHSLHIERAGFNHSELRINASLDDGTIMGIEHCKYPIYGVQFHPESILSGYAAGSAILNNFIAMS